MREKKAKVLVLSIDVWNNFSGSDTFSNLLSGYDSNLIANIFFKEGTPNSKVCNKYFYISENAVIRSIFLKNTKTGKTISRNQVNVTSKEMTENIFIEKFRTFFSKHRLWMFLFAREALWKLGKWQSVELDEFINEFSPDVVFFPIESYYYFNRISQYIIQEKKIPAIGIMWDDNFTYRVNPHNIGFLVHRFFLRRQVKNLMIRCQKLYVINPKMRAECEEKLGFHCEILTKGAVFDDKHEMISNLIDINKYKEKPINIVYTGKLNLGRLETIKLLSNAVEKLNSSYLKKGRTSEKNLLFEFHIYSGTKLTKREKQFLDRLGIYFEGYVPQNEIADIHKRADVLLVAEAIKGKYKYAARLSFSTKIVDYLSSGKCILAIGPENIAPIEYLKENEAALIVSSKKVLEKTLFELSCDPEMLIRYGENAFKLAQSKHDIHKIQQQLYQTFQGVSGHSKV